ncbi:hypothetical protein, partial [Aeromonas caviae]|uniref:hypothetical protein n=1 Tax=Aeromonas caviae TaxID=648 RepID=UPI002B486101
GVFGDSQFTSTLSVNFHFPKIPRRTKQKAIREDGLLSWNLMVPGVGLEPTRIATADFESAKRSYESITY